MKQPQTARHSNEASAEPMRGLSKRAQKLLGPKPYGQRTPVVTGRNQGDIPKALRSGG